MLYQQFGDKQIIEKHYGSMKKWLLYMKTKFVKDGIVTKDQYGDWCVPPEKPNLIHSKDSTRITDGLLIGTAFYYKLLTLMGKFANLVEKQEDKIEFTNEAKLVKTAFNKRFFNAEANQYGNNTVTANILPLYFGLIPNEKVEAVFNQMTKRIGEIDKNHISTGIVGIQFLMRGLTAYGRPDLALKLATNRDFPSWGYMVENGATTIWELWNGNTADPAMNSGNHVMLLGDFNIWLYQYLGGIRNSEGSMGYRHIELKPCPVNGLDYVNSSYKSPYGKIVSNWKKVKNKLVWDFTIPCNTSATVYIPTAKGYKKKEFGSGNYHVSSSLK
jgi:alpha-L-rhamnosidase